MDASDLTQKRRLRAMYVDGCKKTKVKNPCTATDIAEFKKYKLVGDVCATKCSSQPSSSG